MTDAAQPSKRTDNDPLLAALARAYRWQRLVDNGTHNSLNELAATEGVDRSRVGKIIRLILLAPDLIEAILDGTEPETMTLDQLFAPFAIEWWRQRAGFLG